MITEALTHKLLDRHIALIDYLTTYTFSKELPDKRAFNSILFLLPLPAQILCINWSYRAELYLKDKYSKVKRDLKPSIEEPISLLSINNEVINEVLDPYHLNVVNNLSKNNLPIENLKVLLGIDNLPKYNPNDKYYTQIKKTLETLCDLKEESIDILVDIYITNNRMRALTIILNYFDYEKRDKIMRLIDEELSRP